MFWCDKLLKIGCLAKRRWHNIKMGFRETGCEDYICFRTGSGLCPLADLGISGLKASGFSTERCWLMARDHVWWPALVLVLLDLRVLLPYS
jgi:hypothetical protein